MLKTKPKSIQEWLPFEEIYEKGIIKMKQDEYIKIMKVIPINFNLKSNLEKQAILDSYKNFLKTINFNLQILIQSKKENLSNIISNIQEQREKQSLQIQQISKNYIEFIQKRNQENNSASKNFYIIIKENKDVNKHEIYDNQTIMQELNEKYRKIQEGLAKCGNLVIELSEKEETIKVIQSFLSIKNNNIY